MTVKNPRDFWFQECMYWFPMRHSDNTSVRNNARGMIKSMIKHGKSHKLWKAGMLKNQTSNI